MRFEIGEEWSSDLNLYIEAFHMHYDLSFTVDRRVRSYPYATQRSEEDARGIKFQFKSKDAAKAFVDLISCSLYDIARCNAQTFNEEKNQYEKKKKQIVEASVILRGSIFRQDLGKRNYNEIEAFVNGIKADPIVASRAAQFDEREKRYKRGLEEEGLTEELSPAKRYENYQKLVRCGDREAQKQYHRRVLEYWRITTVKFERNRWSSKNVLYVTFEYEKDTNWFKEYYKQQFDNYNKDPINKKDKDENTLEIVTPNMDRLKELSQPAQEGASSSSGLPNMCRFEELSYPAQERASSSSGLSKEKTHYERLLSVVRPPLFFLPDLAFFVSEEPGGTLDVPLPVLVPALGYVLEEDEGPSTQLSDLQQDPRVVANVVARYELSIPVEAQNFAPIFAPPQREDDGSSPEQQQQSNGSSNLVVQFPLGNHG